MLTMAKYAVNPVTPPGVLPYYVLMFNFYTSFH